MEQEALAPLKVKFTHLPKSKRFKELYKILSKSDGLKLTVKTGLIYPLIDADRILKELHDYVHTPEFKEDKKERLFISFVLLSNETNIAYEISRYSLMNNKYTIKDIVEEQLDTTYIDPEKYDNGKSDFKEDARLLKERIQEAYEIKSNKLSENVSVTNKKPSAFNKFFSSRKNREEAEQEIENEKIIETGNKEDKEIEEMKVIEDLPNEENKIKEKHIEDTNNDKEDKEDLKETSELTNEENNVNQEVYKPNTHEENEVVENEKNLDEKKEQSYKESFKEPKKEENKKNHTQDVIIPKLAYETPEISLLTGNYVSKSVQEYLNEAEYERVLQKNKKIEDYNNELNSYYLDLKKEIEEKLNTYLNENKPREEDLTELKEKELGELNGKITSFEKDLTSKNKELLSMKTEELENELNSLKESNKEKIEQLKKELELEEKSFEEKKNSITDTLEKEHEKELSEKLSKYREDLQTASRERVENVRQKNLDKFYIQRDQYRHDLMQNMAESLKNKYSLYQNELSELTHDSYISKIKNDIKKIKENAERHHEKIEKEKSRQAIEKTRLKELELKDIDVRKLQEEKEHNISEQKRIEAENRERELQIKEKQQADDHVARMKELELKYIQPKKAEQPKFNRFLAGILSMLFALVLLILIGAYVIFNTAQGETYESLLNNQDYSSIAEHYPDKVDHLSEELYKKEDSQGLEQLNNETNNELANFRYQLMNNSKEDIITSYENISDKGKLKDAERLKVAQAYLDNNQFEEAREINQTLNDREINKQLAEIEYYNQMKAELEEVIEKSKDKEEVKKAEKELKQVNIILGNK
ncbi:hypothetical protein HMPREF2767_02945 [Nosocomiicoccus sp. HMSC067E10]|uniref:hypothetical protein n=1 Tax=Nosocomiicoccus sp. HMSC067E10 TaxID=1739271 RepID=UPI0008A20284|nr:hypothetical protein [Nosocomiicoccus sp. HMSC067E10]OFL47379.1 hypothetical protein HMPREF2767_02945 [Nosocomiicoccus sp. HMSC067E10]